MKFSIIVPVYNVRDQLPRAVESLFKQTFTDWEAVLVDDGSVDGSSHLCDKLAETDARIKVIHQVLIMRMVTFSCSGTSQTKISRRFMYVHGNQITTPMYVTVVSVDADGKAVAAGTVRAVPKE